MSGGESEGAMFLARTYGISEIAISETAQISATWLPQNRNWLTVGTWFVSRSEHTFNLGYAQWTPNKITGEFTADDF